MTLGPDERGGPIVVIGAETNNQSLSHSLLLGAFKTCSSKCLLRYCDAHLDLLFSDILRT